MEASRQIPDDTQMCLQIMEFTNFLRKQVRQKTPSQLKNEPQTHSKTHARFLSHGFSSPFILHRWEWDHHQYMALAMIISLITTKLLPFFYITIDLMIVVVVAVRKTQVMVHTLGTDSWRLIQDFPSLITGTTYLKSGKFVSGTINWLVCRGDWSIVSLDLRTVSYQQILPPDYGEEKFTFKLGVSRDCLCILGDHLCRRVGVRVASGVRVCIRAS
ncbi:transmembrane protein, putative [Medicago truncatula]|uniref:Transmembrane protein, putative n=1 Tax=Medicago truncatula TaxID=3880 RepID=A0A072UDK5_MEDTR|nr:transmembrane protein, putative [Medicago truncatula]